jgi:hypothetical protein
MAKITACKVEIITEFFEYFSTKKRNEEASEPRAWEKNDRSVQII